jgi:uncharacterized protein (TIGR02145 family)
MKNAFYVVIILLNLIIINVNAQNEYIDEIESLSKRCKEGNKNACNKINDIALNDKNQQKRVLAIEKITDQSKIKAIVLNDKDQWVRVQATKTITDQVFLKDLATNDKEPFVRIAATENITDKNFAQAVLIDLALNKIKFDTWTSTNDEVRKAAINKLTNQLALAEIALNVNDDENLRIVAIENLTDQNVLKDIVTNTEYSNIVQAAIGKIDIIDTMLINKILIKNNHSNLSICGLIPFDLVFKSIFQTIKINTKTYKRIELYEQGHSVESYSYNVELFIADQLVLSKRYGTDGDMPFEEFSGTKKYYYGEIYINQICDSIISRIPDKDIQLIFQESIFPDLRIACIRRIKDNAVLGDIARNDKNENIRKAALEQQIILKPKETGTFKDIRDGRVYKTVKIGDQWIMAENFAFKPDSGNYWAFYNDQRNLATYGYLYDWETGKKIAPAGWHLPTAEEWNTLYNYLGGDDRRVYLAVKNGGWCGFNALLPDTRYNRYVIFLSAGSGGAVGAKRFVWSFYFNSDNEKAHMTNSQESSQRFFVRLFKDN